MNRVEKIKLMNKQAANVGQIGLDFITPIVAFICKSSKFPMSFT